MTGRIVDHRRLNPVETQVSEVGRVESFRDRTSGALRAELGRGLTATVSSPSTESFRHYPAMHLIRMGVQGKERHEFNLVLSNASGAPIEGLTLSLDGTGIESERVSIGTIEPGASIELTLQYLAERPTLLPPLDAFWEENVPVKLIASYSSGGKARTASSPIDYAFYAGWWAPPSACDWLQMSREPQPGLMAQAGRIRAMAERALGAPIDDTPLARITAAAQLVSALRAMGARYEADPAYMRRGRIFHGNAQYPVETLYYGGDCEDMSILYGHFLGLLGVPYAIEITQMHAYPLVELHRGDGEPDIPEPYRALTLERRCGDENCMFLPVDIAQIDKEKHAQKEDLFKALVEECYEGITANADKTTYFETSSDAQFNPICKPGRSWLSSLTWIPPRED